MKAKRLVFPSKRKVEVESFDVADSPGAGQLFIENSFGLISPGTELAMYTESHVGFVVPEFKYAKYPFRPGYAAVGKVLKVGSGVTNIVEGDTVISRCHHASHAIIEARKSPKGVESRLAPFAFLSEIAVTGVFASQVKTGMDVVVFGQGLIGNLAAQWMKAAGARQVIVVDTVPQRLDTARLCGLTNTLNPKECDVAAKVKELTNGVGCHVVIEATGSPEVAVPAMKCAAQLGKVVLLGSPRGSASIELYWDLHRAGIALIGAHAKWLDAFAYQGMPNMADLSLQFMQDGRLTIAPLVTDNLAAFEAANAYEGLLGSPQDHLGILLDLRKWG